MSAARHGHHGRHRHYDQPGTGATTGNLGGAATTAEEETAGATIAAAAIAFAALLGAIYGILNER